MAATATTAAEVLSPPAIPLTSTSAGNAIASTSSAPPPPPPPAGSVKGFLAGVASGLTKLLVGHPFDSIKIRLQCSPPNTYAGPIDCLRRTVALEGPLAVYKGASPPAVGWMLSDSILLGSMNNYRIALGVVEARYRGDGNGDWEKGTVGLKSGELSLWSHMLAGTLGGWTVSTILTPVENLKTKLQMQTTGPKLYTGPIDAAIKTYRAQGVGGLWKGFTGMLYFRTFLGPMFGMYEVVNRSEWAKKLNPNVATFMAGGIASTFFWTIAFPWDGVKNRLMADSITNPRYPTWRSAASQIWREGGAKAFYRGFGPGVTRAFPTNASAMVVWEGAMKLMGENR